MDLISEGEQWTVLKRDLKFPVQELNLSSLDIHWKDWCWSWRSNTLAIWCKELTHWKRPWCWEKLTAGGEGDDRGWDGWMHHRLNGHEFGQTLGDGEGREAWQAAVPAVTKSRTWLSDWTTTKPGWKLGILVTRSPGDKRLEAKFPGSSLSSESKNVSRRQKL